jgi:hypothetical protein
VLGGAPLWHPSCLSGFVGVSGAYDLEGLAAHLHRRGLYKNLLDTIMSIDGQVGAPVVGRACGCCSPGTCLWSPASGGKNGISASAFSTWLQLGIMLDTLTSCSP